MVKNLIPEIARMLGVEIGEEFKIKYSDYEDTSRFTHRFAPDRLYCRYTGDGHSDAWVENSAALLRLVEGRGEVVKLPCQQNMRS